MTPVHCGLSNAVCGLRLRDMVCLSMWGRPVINRTSAAFGDCIPRRGSVGSNCSPALVFVVVPAVVLLIVVVSLFVFFVVILFI